MKTSTRKPATRSPALRCEPPGPPDGPEVTGSRELKTKGRPEGAGAAGKAVLFATEDVVIGDSERWLERGVRDVPHPGERIVAGRPICTLVATATTPEDALAGLEARAARVRAELEPRVEVVGWLT